MRVRYSVRPKDYLRITDLRLVICSWLFARQNNGKFILRIDDIGIDPSESKRYETSILEDLKWMGLSYDEGPSINGEYEGNFASYRQSERIQFYLEEAERLVKEQKMYYCFCDEIVCNCAALTDSEIADFKKSGKKYKIKFMVSKNEIRFKDLVREEIVIPGNDIQNIKDFVIVHEGVPSLDFASAIDDNLMEITHFFQEEKELYKSSLRYLLLTDALEFKKIEFGHIPPLFTTGGKELAQIVALNKPIKSLREEGYLPMAIYFHLALPEASPMEGVLAPQAISQLFRVEHFSRGRSIYNLDALKLINMGYLVHESIKEISNRVQPYLENQGYVLDDEKRVVELIDLLRKCCCTLSEISTEIGLFYGKPKPFKEFDEDVKRLLTQSVILFFLKRFLVLFEQDQRKYAANVVMEMIETAKGEEIILPNAYTVVKATLTGKLHRPNLNEILPYLTKSALIQIIKDRLDEIIGSFPEEEKEKIKTKLSSVSFQEISKKPQKEDIGYSVFSARRELVDDVCKDLEKKKVKSVIIQGPWGTGKTWILGRIRERLLRTESYLFEIKGEWTKADNFLYKVYQELILNLIHRGLDIRSFEIVTDDKFDSFKFLYLLEKLDSKLEILNQNYIILIDDFDQLIDTLPISLLKDFFKIPVKIMELKQIRLVLAMEKSYSAYQEELGIDFSFQSELVVRKLKNLTREETSSLTKQLIGFKLKEADFVHKLSGGHPMCVIAILEYINEIFNGKIEKSFKITESKNEQRIIEGAIKRLHNYFYALWDKSNLIERFFVLLFDSDLILKMNIITNDILEPKGHRLLNFFESYKIHSILEELESKNIFFVEMEGTGVTSYGYYAPMFKKWVDSLYTLKEFVQNNLRDLTTAISLSKVSNLFELPGIIHPRFLDHSRKLKLNELSRACAKVIQNPTSNKDQKNSLSQIERLFDLKVNSTKDTFGTQRSYFDLSKIGLINPPEYVRFFPLFSSTASAEDVTQIEHAILTEGAGIYVILCLGDSSVLEPILNRFPEGNIIIIDEKVIKKAFFEPDLIKFMKNHIANGINPSWISPYQTEAAVPPAMFFGRNDEINLITSLRERGVGIIGGRAIGKTSLLKRLKTILDSSENIILEINCQEIEIKTPQALKKKIMNELQIKLESLRHFPPIFKRKQTFSPMRNEEDEFASKFINLAKTTSRKIISLIDEIDEILTYDDKEHDFAKLVRAIAQSDVNAFFVFAGFTELSNASADGKHPFYNFISPIWLGKIDGEAARRLIIVPMENIGMEIEPKTVNKIIFETSNHPNLIQIFCSLLLKLKTKSNRTITDEDVKNIAEDSSFLNHVYEKFIPFINPVSKAILILLSGIPSFSLDKVEEAFKTRGIEVKLGEIHVALYKLQTCSLITQKGKYFEVQFPCFARALAKIESREKIINEIKEK